jgi:hypothetical protein
LCGHARSAAGPVPTCSKKLVKHFLGSENSDRPAVEADAYREVLEKALSEQLDKRLSLARDLAGRMASAQ